MLAFNRHAAASLSLAVQAGLGDMCMPVPSRNVMSRRGLRCV